MQQIDSVAARDEEAAKERDWPIQIAKRCTQQADAAQGSEDHSGPMLLHGSGGIALGVPAKGVEHGHQKEKSEAVWAESTESLQEGIAREEEIAKKEWHYIERYPVETHQRGFVVSENGAGIAEGREKQDENENSDIGSKSTGDEVIEFTLLI